MTLGHMTAAIVVTTMTEGEEVATTITGVVGAATMTAEIVIVIANAAMDVTMIVVDGTKRGGTKGTSKS